MTSPQRPSTCSANGGATSSTRRGTGSAPPSCDYTQGGPSTSTAPSMQASSGGGAASSMRGGTGPAPPSRDYTQGGPSTSRAPPNRPTMNGSNKRHADEDLPRTEVPLPTYNVDRVSHKHNRKFNANTVDYSISFQPVAQNGPMIDMLPRVSVMFDEIVDDMLQGANDRDYVRIVFNAPQLDKPVSMPFVKRNQLDKNAFSAKLESVLYNLTKRFLSMRMFLLTLYICRCPKAGKT